MALEQIARTMHIRFREEVPISELSKDLFCVEAHYDRFVKEAQGKSNAYVHIVANGVNGVVEVVGVSHEPDGRETGKAYDVIGKGAVPFLLKRMAQIRAHFTPPVELYAISVHPGGKIDADSRKL